MTTLKVPGAVMSYEVRGNGPLLILIPGAIGAGDVFSELAQSLSTHYRVVTYDRRGFSHSELVGRQDYHHRLDTDADDVRRLIEQQTDKPAIIFGNSSGAIVALEVLIHYPQKVSSAVAHEPPAVKLLPDGSKWLAFFDDVYHTYRKSGVSKAMQQFTSGTTGAVDHQLTEKYLKEHTLERSLANVTYWMDHELRQYPRVELDLDALALHSKQIVLAGGRDSHDGISYQPNKVLAHKLELEVVDLPGGHLGFMGYPVEFATELTTALQDRVPGK